jgi:hypothetical protein
MNATRQRAIRRVERKSGRDFAEFSKVRTDLYRFIDWPATSNRAIGRMITFGG